MSAFSFIYHTTLYDDTVAHVALYLRQFDEREFKFFKIGVGTERRTWKKKSSALGRTVIYIKESLIDLLPW